MLNLFKTKITVIYMDNEGREHRVVRRIWEKKDENGDYYVTAIQMSYPNGGFAIPIEHIHNRIVPSEWKFMRKKVDYLQREATSQP